MDGTPRSHRADILHERHMLPTFSWFKPRTTRNEWLFPYGHVVRMLLQNPFATTDYSILELQLTAMVVWGNRHLFLVVWSGFSTLFFNMIIFRIKPARVAGVALAVAWQAPSTSFGCGALFQSLARVRGIITTFGDAPAAEMRVEHGWTIQLRIVVYSCLFAIIFTFLPSRRQLLKWVMIKKHSTRFRPLPCFVFDIVEGLTWMLKGMRCLGRFANLFGHVWPWPFGWHVIQRETSRMVIWRLFFRRGVGDFCIFLWALTGHWLSKATNNNLKIWFEFRGAEFGLAPLSVEDVESAFSWALGEQLSSWMT